MSGIYGYLRSSAESDETLLKRLELWNRAYGNRGCKQRFSSHFGLGCNLEKLSDNAPVGSPVFQIEDSVYAIDALLYNREELLQKGSFSAELSDEELLVHYLNSFGIGALAEVNGDFSGAILDLKTNQLTLFRDHIGVRPLYYYLEKDFTAFSTDIRALTALPSADTSINEEWLYKSVMGLSTIHPTQTEFSHIFCVPPAGILTFRLNDDSITVCTKAYWTIGKKKIRLSSEKEYQEKLRELISDAVTRRLSAASGPFGAELSGGLDSGVIDILLNRTGRKGFYFSWSSSPEDLPLVPKDERLVIQDICNQENISCSYLPRTLTLDSTSIIANHMRDAGFPLSDADHESFRYLLTPSTNILQICETAQFLNRSGAKIVFTGHGGDEGVSHRSRPYELFHYHEYYRFLRLLWSRTHGKKHRIAKTLKACYDNLWKRRAEYHDPLQTFLSTPDLLQPEFAARFRKLKTLRHLFGFDPVAYIRNGGSRFRLEAVAQLGAYNGVRYVVPYLDYRVVDYAVSIPRYLYLRGFRNRFIFREAFKDLMPKSLYILQDKRDTSMLNAEPDPNWFEEFRKNREECFAKLSREKWSRYLNFELLDTWINQGKPTEEEQPLCENIMHHVSTLALLETITTKAREVTDAALKENASK